MRILAVLVLSLLVVATAAPRALAQPVDAATKVTARGLAEEGVKLYDQGDYAGALDKLGRANDLVHAPTMALMTGRCLEKLGRLVEASEKYLEATRDEIDAGTAGAQKKAQADAEKARQALLPRLASVEIAVDGAANGATVTLDGKPVPAAMLGAKRPIDPGKHTAELSRGGAVVASKSFELKEAEATRIALAASASPAGVGPAADTAAAAATAPDATTPPRKRRRSTALFVIGISSMGVGAVVGVTGAAIWGAAKKAESTSTTNIAGASISSSCGTNGVECPSTTNKNQQALGGAMVVGGVVLLVGGIVMTVIGGHKVDEPPASTHAASAPPKLAVEPLVGPGFAGLRGSF